MPGGLVRLPGMRCSPAPSGRRPHPVTRSVRAATAMLLTAVLAGACTAGEPGGNPGPTPSRSGAPRSPTASPDPVGTPGDSSPTAGAASPKATPAPRPTGSPRVDSVVTQGLDVPWGLAFLPDGSALVSERDRGHIVQVRSDGEQTDLGEVPGVRPRGEGGLLGLAVGPDFARDRLVYAYFTAEDDNRVVRMRWDGGRLGRPQVLLDGIPRAGNHNGGRLAFGPDGFLYVTTGDAGERSNAQDRESLGGKILRVTSEGQPAPGNPFPGSPVYSYGHRNVQGIGWDARGGLWASEFGQNTWDELNLVVAGRNYGWPEVEGRGGSSRYADPLAVWATSDASPSGVAVTGDAVYLAALRGSRLWRVPLSGTRVGRPEAFFTGDYGRLRTVAVAPDGSLWLMTSNTDGRGRTRRGDDRILRLTMR